MKFILKLFFILFYLFIISFIFFYSEINNKNKNSNQLLYQLENLIYQNIDAYFMQTSVLLKDELIDNISKNDIKKIELSFDNFVSIFTNCELIILSDLKGKIIATNTKNSRYKSFNNTELKTHNVNYTSWFNNVPVPSKLKDVNFANTFYLEKIASQYKNTSTIEILVSLLDISGARVAILTLYYNIDSVLGVLNRFNISFKDANNKNIGSNISIFSKEFNKTNYRYINSRNFKILNNDYALYNIVTIGYFNIYIVGILLLIIFLIIINNFKIQKHKKANYKLEEFNKLYNELGIFLDFKNKNLKNGKIIKHNNKDIFIDANLIDLASKEFIEEILKLEELLESKNKALVNLEHIKEDSLNIQEKNNFLNQELLEFQKKINNLNKYIEKTLSINFTNNADIKNSFKDKLDLNKYLEEEKALLNEIINSKDIINKLVEAIYNKYLLNTSVEKYNVSELIISLKDEFFKLKIYINNIKNLIKDLNIEDFFNTYKTLYDNNLELSNIYNELLDHKEKSKIYENAINHIKTVLEKKD